MWLKWSFIVYRQILDKHSKQTPGFAHENVLTTHFPYKPMQDNGTTFKPY